MSMLRTSLGWVRRTLIRRPKAFRVVVIGGSEEWRQVLQPGAPAWQALPGIEAARLDEVKDEARVLRLYKGRRELLLPLKEPDILAEPRGGWVLLPHRKIVRILRNKRRFAEYFEARGLGHLLPRHYASADEAVFPCVVKKVRSGGSAGVRLVQSRAELDAVLAEPKFVGRPILLQELFATSEDDVGYFVMVRGRIVWHCAYRYHLPEPGLIRPPKLEMPVDRYRFTAEELALFESVFAPMNYSGPVNVDLKRRPDGSLVFIEINARLGGSLMQPRNLDDLRAALAAIAEHAQWRGTGLAVDLLRLRPEPRRASETIAAEPAAILTQQAPAQ